MQSFNSSRTYSDGFSLCTDTCNTSEHKSSDPFLHLNFSILHPSQSLLLPWSMGLQYTTNSTSTINYKSILKLLQSGYLQLSTTLVLELYMQIYHESVGLYALIFNYHPQPLAGCRPLTNCKRFPSISLTYLSKLAHLAQLSVNASLPCLPRPTPASHSSTER